MERLKHAHKWNAVGSKGAKKLLLSLLMKNGFKAFDGKKTALNCLYDGNTIKHVDINRKSQRGNYFISSDDVDRDCIVFDLDKVDVYWALSYILEPR